MSTVTIQVVGSAEVAARVQQMGSAARAILYAKMGELSILLQEHVTAKLSGEVLNIRTGNLKASIVQDVVDDGDTITGRVYSNATVKYAAIHEFGGIIKHPGGTPYLIFEMNGKSGGGQAFFISKAAAAAAPDPTTIPVTKPHDIPMPERSFLRSSLTEMKSQLIQGMIDGMKAGLAG